MSVIRPTTKCISVKKILNEQFTRLYKTATAEKIKTKRGELIISCKRKEYNHYSNDYYSSLEEVPLASKGWTHNKSKGDFFTILPVAEEYERPTYPFEKLNINEDLINALKSQQIFKATDYQYQAIPIIQSGTHTLLAAETGCGKTLCYLVPIIQNILNGPKSTELNSPTAVIVMPNRELAYQVGDVAKALCLETGLKVKVQVGGRTKKTMLNPEFEEVDILVGTPGALSKLSTVGVYKLNEAKSFVLDEADTLLDNSFLDRVGLLIKRMPQAQVVLVSATIPRTIPDILGPIEETLRHVVSPRIHKPLLNITQKFLRLTKSTRPSHLLEIVKNNKDPMLVFTNKNETCNWLAMFLRENNVKCANINGDMNYAIRIEQWNQFVSGEANVLSATDIGSRGLNTIKVRQVLNYDFPLYAADYIHRIGRVGRIGSPESCKVTNFIVGPREVDLLKQIEYAIRKNKPLENVDGNISGIVQRMILKREREQN